MGLVLDEPQENDIVEEINGVRVAFEEPIYAQTKDLTLEMQETEEGKGLVLLGMNECC